MYTARLFIDLQLRSNILSFNLKSNPLCPCFHSQAGIAVGGRGGHALLFPSILIFSIYMFFSAGFQWLFFLSSFHLVEFFEFRPTALQCFENVLRSPIFKMAKIILFSKV